MHATESIIAAETQPFLQTVVEHLRQQHGDGIGELCLVLPSQRAAIYLKKYLSDAYGKPIWAPEMLSVPEFMAELADLTTIDPVSLAFEFYHVYHKAAGIEAHPFSQFVKWAPVLLKDFNDIDQYLVDTDKLFEFVNEERAMAQWNPEGAALTPFQQTYLGFWGSVGKYYESLKAHLLQQGMAYEGLAARMAARRLGLLQEQGLLHEVLGNRQHIVFIGLNALSKAEASILDALTNAGIGEALWDTDTYYLDNEAQEAGMFLRQLARKGEHAINWRSNSLETMAKTINIVGVTGNVAQAKAAGDLLNTLEQSGTYEDSAVVLANEDLLIPVLQSLPEQVKHVNVTMGYPLGNSPLQSLWSAIFALHENLERNTKPALGKRFYHKDVLNILNHPNLRRLPGGFWLAFTVAKGVHGGNHIFLSPDALEALVQEADAEHLTEVQAAFERLKCLFTDWQHDPNQALQSIAQVLEMMKEALLEVRKTQQNAGSMELEYLFMYSKVIKRIRELAQRYQTIEDLATLRVLFNQVVASHKVSFYGEPLRGLQVMGLLETRTLDFKNVVLLSANEDTLPTGKTENSFLTLETRSAFGLPTYRERDAVFAYHFYRLLQRAENIWLLYNSNTERLGGGEQSRFLTQLAHELPRANPNVTLRETVLNFKLPEQQHIETKINKSPKVLEQLNTYLANGLSPSAVNTYIRCPLDYYYRYVLRLPETEEMEEHIEHTTLGSAVHAVLENYFEPLIGQPVQPHHVEQMLESAEADTTQHFREVFDKSHTDYGKNLLIVKVAIRFVRNYLKAQLHELALLQSQQLDLVVLATEAELGSTLEVPIKGGHGASKIVQLTGKADRIDQIGDTVRIIDYKTGKVESRDLKYNNLDELFEDTPKLRALQPLMYGMMWASQNDNPAHAHLQSGIVSFRNLSEGFMPVNQSKKPPHIRQEQLDEFKALLVDLIADVLDQEVPFQHRDDAKYCIYCEG